MRRSAAPSFAALATVLVTMLVLGVFIPIVQATNGAANTVRSRVLVDVYMKSERHRRRRRAGARRAARPCRTCARSSSSPSSRRWRSSRRWTPGLRAAVGQPAARHLPRDPGQPGQRAGGPQRADPAGPAARPARSTPAIQSVSNKKNDTRKILEVTNLVTITAAALTVLLTLASVLLIANTIRLSLYARRREVEVMKLVGATDWFIRWPFVIEGIIVGAAGALLAIGVLGVAKVAAARSAGQQLDADRGAADDRVPGAGRGADGGGRASSRRSAPGCRCAASCASERLANGASRSRRRSGAGAGVSGRLRDVSVNNSRHVGIRSRVSEHAAWLVGPGERPEGRDPMQYAFVGRRRLTGRRRRCARRSRRAARARRSPLGGSRSTHRQSGGHKTRRPASPAAARARQHHQPAVGDASTASR